MRTDCRRAVSISPVGQSTTGSVEGESGQPIAYVRAVVRVFATMSINCIYVYYTPATQLNSCRHFRSGVAPVLLDLIELRFCELAVGAGFFCLSLFLLIPYVLVLNK